MRIDLEHVEKSSGLVFRKTLFGLRVNVTFSEEELAIIRTRKLERTIVCERGVPADVNVEKHENRGIVKRLATAAVAGADANHFHLTIGKLMRGPDIYFLATPLEVKHYENVLREELPKLKAYIVENEGVEQKSDSFEL